MTLVLAAWVDGAAMLAADRRVLIGPRGGPHVPADGHKLFLVGQCAVASIGENPAGIDVPRAIRERPELPASPETAARHLNEVFSPFTIPGGMMLVVVGFGPGGPEAWEAIGMQRQNFEAGLLHSWGSRPALTGPPLSQPDQIQTAMLQVFRQVAQQDQAVGPPFEVAILRSPAKPFIVQMSLG